MANEATDPNASSNLPPPPPEVQVRTMRSDLAALRQSGGSSPQFKTVPVEGLSRERISMEEDAHSGLKKPPSELWGIVAIAILVLGALIFFGYEIFLRK